MLFAGIFVAIIPVLAMLQAGRDGAFAWLLHAVTAQTARRTRPPISGSPAGCRPSSTTRRPIWCSSSSPAAMPRELMGPLAGTLAAISMGAVYMGALTYIGNAPNLMVYAIANERGVKHAELLRLPAVGGLRAGAAVPDPHAAADFADSQARLT